MKTVLVTGATGFVGKAVVPALVAHGWTVRACARRPEDLTRLPRGCQSLVVGDIGPQTDWSQALEDVEAVVHLAGRAHQDATGAENDMAHDRVNFLGTQALAEQAARAGVARFIFLSSVKAMGEHSPRGMSWTEKSPCNPVDAYGRSKLAAEGALAKAAGGGGMSVLVLRAPLVYGPGVGANMAKLTRLVRSRLPLPFGLIGNRRSFIFLGNLAQAIARALGRPSVTGVFLIKDSEDLSTPELARRLAQAMGRRALLLPVPVFALRLAAACLGKSAEAERLLGDLAVDDSQLREQLGWQPPFSIDEGLRAMVEGGKND